MKIFIVKQNIKKCSDHFVVIAFAMLCAKVQQFMAKYEA